MPLRAPGPNSSIVPVPHRSEALSLPEHSYEHPNLIAGEAGVFESTAQSCRHRRLAVFGFEGVDQIEGKSFDQISRGTDTELAEGSPGTGSTSAVGSDRSAEEV